MKKNESISDGFKFATKKMYELATKTARISDKFGMNWRQKWYKLATNLVTIGDYLRAYLLSNFKRVPRSMYAVTLKDFSWYQRRSQCFKLKLSIISDRWTRASRDESVLVYSRSLNLCDSVLHGCLVWLMSSEPIPSLASRKRWKCLEGNRVLTDL